MIKIAWESQVRHTIKDRIIVEGVGAHSGELSQVTLTPLHAPHGVLLNGVPLHEWSHEAKWATRLISPRSEVSILTPEHLLAALYGAGVDDVEITVDSLGHPTQTLELPILDGSAWPWLSRLTPSPTAKGAHPRVWSTLPTLKVNHQQASISCTPKTLTEESGPLTARLNMSLADLYPELLQDKRPQQDKSVLLKPLSSTLITADQFYKQIAPARTFGLAQHEHFLRAQGLIKGVSEETCLIINEEGTPHKPLSHPNELAAHKLLDCLGDLALSAQRWRGHIEVQRGSHALNHALLKALKGYDHDGVMIANSKNHV